MPEIVTDVPEQQKIILPPEHKAWWKRLLYQIGVLIISLIIVLGGLALAGWKLYSYYFGPMNANSDGTVEVEIPRGASTAKIAAILEEKQLIRNADIFRYYVDFSNNAGKLKAGIYQLKPNMNMVEIMNEMLSGKAMVPTKVFTIVPGQDVESIADSLVKQGIIKNKDRFLELAKSDQFDSYWFIAALDNTDKRIYKLEGYLYPDTYQVYADATEEQVITKMLDQFDKVFSDEYKQRAEELKMSPDQVVTLASIIEKEARSKDFKKVSAVFHNRLAKNMPLQSNTTISYVKRQPILLATKDDLNIDSPYNTYKYKGLPVGAICSPSKDAIEAALYPEPSFLNKYYYFVVTDPNTFEIVYTQTLAEHNKISAKYKDVWLQWQRQHSGNNQ